MKMANEKVQITVAVELGDGAVTLVMRIRSGAELSEIPSALSAGAARALARQLLDAAHAVDPGGQDNLRDDDVAAARVPAAGRHH
jgi:hypothetical protein